MIRVYTYKNCDTCRKALRWLCGRGVEFEECAIRERPPTRAELKRMLGYYDGDFKRLFNTTGKDYREGGYKDRLEEMTEAEVFAELAANGNLVKRPFLLGEGVGIVGFKETEWAEKL
ncbi:MAG: Spx/MgsR family RNA polymerase-binding regulatory protein [Verrucomicrobiota bacterium]